jgi:hypothetical protein
MTRRLTDLERTAYHEAGHAAMYFVLRLGAIEGVTVLRGRAGARGVSGESAGMLYYKPRVLRPVRFEGQPCRRWRLRRDILRRMLVACAGPHSEGRALRLEGDEDALECLGCDGSADGDDEHIDRLSMLMVGSFARGPRKVGTVYRFERAEAPFGNLASSGCHRPRAPETADTEWEAGKGGVQKCSWAHAASGHRQHGISSQEPDGG